MRIDSNQRIHGIDALRGIAMLLGILLHATIAYKVNPLPTWPHDGSFNHWSFDYLYSLIHSFRMPLFFLIAGYFCRLLYYKIGVTAFIRHRIKRILIPFVASLILILPLTIFPFLVYRYSLAEPQNWNKIFSSAWLQLLHWNGMAHLWFLYYLLLYYIAVVILLQIRRIKVITKTFSVISKKISSLNAGNYLALFIASLPVCLILGMVPEQLFLHVNTGILPAASYLLFFGYFFLIGWFINKTGGGIFSWMANNLWILLGLGLGLSIFLFWIEFSGRFEQTTSWTLGTIKLLAGCQIILLVYGSIGFFLRYCQSESKMWKYVSDASYWMYLIHLALVAGLQVLFIEFDIPGILKFGLVLIITLIVTLLTYQFWIRYSVIGEIMHGKRKKPKKEMVSKLLYLFLKKT